MARIPLAAVPNAVHMLPAGPIEVPRVSGQEVAQSLQKVAQAGQQETMSLDAFSGEGKGLAALGQGIQNVGQDIDRMASLQMAIAKRAEEERVNYQVLEGRAKLDADFEAYKAALPEGIDPPAIVDGWKERFPKTLNTVVGDKTLAPAAKQKLTEYGGIAQIKTTSQLSTYATQVTFQRSKQAIVDLAEQQVNSGNLNAAIETYQQLDEKRLVHPGVTDKLIADAKAKTEMNKIEHAIQVNPYVAQKMIEERKSQTGKVSSESKLSVDQLQTLERRTIAAQNHQRSELFGEIKDLVDLNQVQDRADIEAKADGKLDKTAIDMLDARRTGKQIDPEFYTQLWADANNYDPAKDLTGAQRLSIDTRIHMLPEGAKEGPRSRLNAAKAPNYELEKVYSKQISSALSAGAFGDVETVKAKDYKETGNRVPRNPTESTAAHEQASKLQYEFHEWAKANPKAAPKDAQQWISDRVKEAARAKAATQVPSRSWWDKAIDFEKGAINEMIKPFKGAEPTTTEKARATLREVIPDSKKTSSIPERAKELGKQLVQSFGGRFEQWADRDVRGRPGVKSKHATGEAIDYYGQDLSTVAQQLATADKTKRVIYNHKIWDPSRGWHPYTGVDPHTDHVHIEPA